MLRKTVALLGIVGALYLGFCSTKLPVHAQAGNVPGPFACPSNSPGPGQGGYFYCTIDSNGDLHIVVDSMPPGGGGATPIPYASDGLGNIKNACQTNCTPNPAIAQTIQIGATPLPVNPNAGSTCSPSGLPCGPLVGPAAAAGGPGSTNQGVISSVGAQLMSLTDASGAVVPMVTPNVSFPATTPLPPNATALFGYAGGNWYPIGQLSGGVGNPLEVAPCKTGGQCQAFPTSTVNALIYAGMCAQGTVAVHFIQTSALTVNTETLIVAGSASKIAFVCSVSGNVTGTGLTGFTFWNSSTTNCTGGTQTAIHMEPVQSATQAYFSEYGIPLFYNTAGQTLCVSVSGTTSTAANFSVDYIFV